VLCEVRAPCEHPKGEMRRHNSSDLLVVAGGGNPRLVTSHTRSKGLDVETADGPVRRKDPNRHGNPSMLALVLVWSGAEPERVGEVLLPPQDDPSRAVVLGRAGPEALDNEERAIPVQQRPGLTTVGQPLSDKFLSRRQLRLKFGTDAIELENLGKRPLRIDDSEARSGVVREGDLLECKDVLLWMCVRRPQELPPIRHSEQGPSHAFGAPDLHGFVGESATAWALRDEIAFAAHHKRHALLLGESGTGKELVAQAIHRMSPRAARPLVTRNAATLPSGIIDAELFGNIANYPQAGMPERAGVFGDADGGSLFLDEIGDLPQELQIHLLRVMDSGGEYQRLGDARRRSADVRIIGATNRPLSEIRADLQARLPLRISIPSLNERRDDIPLLVNHLLCRIAVEDARIAERFFSAWDKRRHVGAPRVSIDLMRALLQRSYTTHVRELGQLLWIALRTSPGDMLELTDAVEEEIAGPPGSGPRKEPTADEVRDALERHAGVQARAWRDLGLANRFALRRLMKRYGI
jgi:DNA-binding NtrC family response regulator